MTSLTMTSGGRRLDRLQRRRAVAHRFDLKANGEQAGQIVAHVGVVVGDQNSGRRAAPSRTAACLGRKASRRGAIAAPLRRRALRPGPAARTRASLALETGAIRSPRKMRRADRETHGEHRSFSEGRWRRRRCRRGWRRVRGQAPGRCRNLRACAPRPVRCGEIGRRRGRDPCGAMPIPVSRTRSSTCVSVAASATPIEPWNVNLNAFESRLRTIFSHISRST